MNRIIIKSDIYLLFIVVVKKTEYFFNFMIIFDQISNFVVNNHFLNDLHSSESKHVIRFVLLEVNFDVVHYVDQIIVFEHIGDVVSDVVAEVNEFGSVPLFLNLQNVFDQFFNENNFVGLDLVHGII